VESLRENHTKRRVFTQPGSFCDMQKCSDDLCSCANSRHWMRCVYEFTPVTGAYEIATPGGKVPKQEAHCFGQASEEKLLQ
jgi:hypothetical protein